MAKISKPSGFSKLITALFIVTVIISTTLVLWAVSAPRAFAAAEAAVSADYSAVGQTSLATTYRDGAGTIEGSGGLDGSGGNSADHFTFYGDLLSFGTSGAGNRVSFGADGMSLGFTGARQSSDGYYFGSKKKIEQGSPLSKAFAEAGTKYTVKARIDAETEFEMGDNNALLETNLIWDDGAGNTVSESRKQSGGSAIGFEINALTMQDAANASLSVEFRFPGDALSDQNTKINVKIKNVRVTFGVSLNDAGNVNAYRAEATAEITGQNRLPSAFSAGDASAHYVKAEDQLEINLDLFKGDDKFLLGSSYKEIFGGSSAVQWSAEQKQRENSDTVIARFDNLVIATENDLKQSYSITMPAFGESDDGTVLVLKPSLKIDTTSVNSTLFSLDLIKIVLTIDTVKPEKPLLNANCDLMKYFDPSVAAPSKYYTENTVSVGWKNSAASGSKETLYYTVTRTDFAANADRPSIDSPFVRDNGSGGGTVDLLSGTGAKEGGYALAFMFIDEAGNTSEILTFQKVLNVDVNDYAVYATARWGTDGASSDAVSAADFGTFRFNGNNSSRSVTLKRGQTLSLVYSFSEMNLREYFLYSVYNGKNSPAFNLDPTAGGGIDGAPTFKIDTAGGRTLYTIEFTMDKEEGVYDFISDAAFRNFSFVFKKNLYPVVSGEKKVFTPDMYSLVGGVPTKGLPQAINLTGFYRYDKNTKVQLTNAEFQRLSSLAQIYYGVPDETGVTEYGSAQFSLAGSYKYKVELKSSSETKYYCVAEDDFTISKADPKVLGFIVEPPIKSFTAEGFPSIEFGYAGGIGAFKLLSEDAGGALSDVVTSIGLRGTFRIVNLPADSDTYKNPAVGKYTLNVIFTPEDKNSVNGVLNADNYDLSPTLTATVAVSKKDLNNTGEMMFLYSPDGSPDKAVPFTDDTLIYYTGSAPSLYLNTELLKEKYKIESTHIVYDYRVEGGDYAKNPPISAGKYNVRASISDAVGSYTGVLEITVEILKQTLTVTLSDPSQQKEFVYGYYRAPEVGAKTVDGAGVVSVSFNYRYRAKGAGEFETAIPENAGEYEALVSVLDQNYQGELVFSYTIRKVRAGDAGLTINNPQPQTRPDLGAMLRFGMPLSEMQLSQGSVVYEKANGEKEYVSVVYTAKSLSGGDEFYVPTKQEILRDNNFAFGFEFVPQGEDAINYETLNSGSSVSILAANADFSDVSLPDARYGATLSEILLTQSGKATYRGYADGSYASIPIEDGVFEYVGTEFNAESVPAAGDYVLRFRFRAADGKENLYRSAEFDLPLKVLRNEQILYVLDAEGNEITEFKKNYGAVVTVPTDRVKTREGLQNLEYEYRYFTDYTGGTLMGEIEEIAVKGVGNYFLEISIKDKNYVGSVVLAFIIERVKLEAGTNTLLYPAALGALEWNVNTKLFEQSVDMTGSIYREDAAADSLVRVDGRFSFVTDRAFPDPADAVTVTLRFTPNDEINCEGFEFQYDIPVNKRTVSFDYPKSAVFNASEQPPEIVLTDGGAAVDAEYQKYLLTFENGVPVAAGEYRGGVKVDPSVARYRGEADLVFTILPEAVKVSIAEKDYDAGEAVLPEFTVAAEAGELSGTLSGEIYLEFKDFNGTVVGEGVYDGGIPAFAPKNVGRYTIGVTVGGNHKGNASAEYLLCPTKVDVDSVVIVSYPDTVLQKAEIAPIRDGYEYRYSILYRLKGETAYSAGLPTDAGTYETRIILDENGFYKEYDLGIKYTVEQLKISDISADESLRYAFAVTAPLPTFTAYGVAGDAERKLNYTLSYFDENGARLSNAPAHAGNYKVTAEISERNYFGSADFGFVIEKGGEPRSVGSPETRTVEYKEEFLFGTDGVFVGRGTFLYTVGGKSFKVTGEFTVVTEGFSAFGVGTHGIEYDFRAETAEEDGVIYEIYDTDIAAYRGVTTVTVVKKKLDIADFTVTSPAVDSTGRAVTRYDETQQGVTIAAIGSFFSPKEAKDVAANAVVTYKNLDSNGAAATAKPVAAGKYEVSVTVKHDNYEGNFTLCFVIEKAKPAFVAPTYVKKMKLGENDTLSAGESITSDEPLYAYYEGKKGVPIAGKFTVAETVTFTKANLRAFRAVFTPDDPENVETTDNVVLYVYVLSKTEDAYAVNSEWFDDLEVERYGMSAEIGKITAEAGAGNVRFENGKVFVKTEKGEIEGVLIFQNENNVQDVGRTLLPVYFIPDEEKFGEYQIVSFLLSVVVREKAVVRVEGGIVYATVAAGDTFREAVFTAYLSVADAPAGVLLAPPAEFRFEDGFDLSAVVPANFAELPVVRAVYLGGDNYRSEEVKYEVRFVYDVQEAGILADRTEYEFHLNPAMAISAEVSENRLGVAEYMKISFSGAGDTVPEYSVKVDAIDQPLRTDFEGYGALLYEVGSYRVTVTISKSSGYSGEREFIFKVTKRDISNFIVVNGQDNGTAFERVYLDAMNFLPAAYSPSTGNAYDADFKLSFRSAGEGEFTDSVPVYAGSYTLRAEVDDSDRYYGAKDFEYNVLKKTIAISQSAVSYTYGNAAAELMPKLDENVAWEFRFTDKNGSVLYGVYPENAGEYTGTVTVKDLNYQGSASFFYTVYAAQVTITSLPAYQNLRYGQKLSEAVLVSAGGAQVTLGGAIETANGRFEFTEPDAVLDSGINTVSVRFVPANVNFETVAGSVKITVERVSVEIRIEQTEFEFSGAELMLDRVYTVYPVSGLIPDYVIRKGGSTGEIVRRIYEAGVYYVVFTVDTVNYFQEKAAEITVHRATADAELYGDGAEIQQYKPTAAPLTFGQRLKTSSLTGGKVFYNGVAVSGVFRFREEDATADQVGKVSYPVTFTPNDSENYEPFNGYTVIVTVGKAPVEIIVSGNECVYGDAVPRPTFTVNGIGGTDFGFKLDAEFESWIGKVMPAGTVKTKVVLENEFYYGETEFSFTVKKKNVTMLYFKDADRSETVETYSSVYGAYFEPFPGVKVDELYEGDKTADTIAEINALIVKQYRVGNALQGAVPKAAGSYEIVATSNSANYNAKAEIRYTVNRAKVESVSIETESLTKQVYGNLTVPNVVTSPAEVAVTLDFGNGSALPNAAGSYSLTVRVNDPNFEKYEKSFTFIVNPKKLEVTNVTVSDKVYDGVSNLDATASLSGLVIGDEVYVSVSARIAGGESDPGEYGVEITEVKLYGRHAANYVFETPQCNQTVKVYDNRVADEATGSYIVFRGSVPAENLTVEFKNALSKYNKESFLSTLLGQKAQVVSFNLKSDGVKTDLSEKVTVYVKIPDRFKNAKNLTVEGLGNLEGLIPTRQGDYMVFETSGSGEIVFVVSDFPYGLILVVSGVVIAGFGLLAICLFEPVRKKRAARLYKNREDDK